MNIFDYAISLKKEKEAFYRQVAKQSRSQGIKELFSLLAEEEAHHGEAIEEMSQNVAPHLPKTKVLADAKKVFKKMAAGDEQPGFANEQLKLYEKAIKYEEQAVELYRQKAKEVHDSCQKEILSRISTEETMHKMVIETIINFVSKPERWLENAEWYHLEEY